MVTLINTSTASVSSQHCSAAQKIRESVLKDYIIRCQGKLTIKKSSKIKPYPSISLVIAQR